MRFEIFGTSRLDRVKLSRGWVLGQVSSWIPRLRQHPGKRRTDHALGDSGPSVELAVSASMCHAICCPSVVSWLS
jgi:hypothetical protein